MILRKVFGKDEYQVIPIEKATHFYKARLGSGYDIAYVVDGEQDELTFATEEERDAFWDRIIANSLIYDN